MLRRLPARTSGLVALPRLLPLWAALVCGLLLCLSASFARAGAGVDSAAVFSFLSRSGMVLLAEANAYAVGGASSGTVMLAEAVVSPAATASVRKGEEPGTEPAKPESQAVRESAPASPAANPAATSPAAPANTSVRLFNTVEFRGVLKNMPKWQRVVAAEQKKRTFDRENLNTLMRGSLYNQWLQIVERTKNASTMDKAKAVTVFFNRWPYRTDLDIYKVADYWATPAEFLANSGDCEDYAITKFYALIKLGVDPESMRIVALRDTIRNLAHAILVVYMNDDAYILDNLTDLVLTHKRYQHYWPQYSVNEVYRWAHIRPKK